MFQRSHPASNSLAARLVRASLGLSVAGLLLVGVPASHAAACDDGCNDQATSPVMAPQAPQYPAPQLPAMPDTSDRDGDQG